MEACDDATVVQHIFAHGSHGGLLDVRMPSMLCVVRSLAQLVRPRRNEVNGLGVVKFSRVQNLGWATAHPLRTPMPSTMYMHRNQNTCVVLPSSGLTFICSRSPRRAH
jgi:hypothetical protein